MERYCDDVIMIFWDSDVWDSEAHKLFNTTVYKRTRQPDGGGERGKWDLPNFHILTGFISEKRDSKFINYLIRNTV